MTAVLLTASKNFNVGMHLDVNWSIYFQLGIALDIIVLYILVLVILTLTLIQDHSVNKQKVLLPLSSGVFDWLI